MKNGILFQAFEWYLPDDGNYFLNMITKLDDLQAMGISALWLPPVCKATGINDTGYGVYDLYDLGEFDQKGQIRTKYGTKTELKQLIDEIHKRGMDVYADVVLNHKAGADRTERFKAVMVDESDRTKQISSPKEIEGWTGFDFLGRGNKYSRFKWNHHHFTGVDYDNLTHTKGVYQIFGENKGWNQGVSDEKGNYDYLMFADIDLAHPDVKHELKQWARWFINELNIDGFRMDALKHMNSKFVSDFLTYITEVKGENFYILGEYFDHDLKDNEHFLEAINYKADLFDTGLHYNFFKASEKGADYDLRTIFDQTIVKRHPTIAVTFVDNHDSQPGQSLESFIKPWFKEIAYGLILLRKDGYPCIFYGDYYGLKRSKRQQHFQAKIKLLSRIRRKFAYGQEFDYFNSATCIGWVRHGNDQHPHKCAVIISTKGLNTIRMFVGEEEAGKNYLDYTRNKRRKVKISPKGYGDFKVNSRSISVWIKEGVVV